ncbi:hypothetical protein NGRA_0859 [Nosema granulosis]|uniref:Uncharacterized protein n=1 Tax=Nosema granulosis TaxID=83296 RepID=A0A9P6GZL5_9MICR|nr:hypothetical protein NGRA_0859 [Nosema granulosis]
MTASYNQFSSFPLYILFSMLSVGDQRIRNAIPKDRTVLVFDIEGCLYDRFNNLFEYEKVVARKLYAENASPTSPPNITDAFRKHLSLTKIFYEECKISPKEYFRNKNTIKFEIFLERDDDLRTRLNKLKQMGYSLVVWSSNNLEITRRILGLLYIENVFDVIFYASEDASDGLLEKPMKEANELLARLLDLEKNKQIILFCNSLMACDSGGQIGFRGIPINVKEGIVITLEDFIVSETMHKGLFVNSPNNPIMKYGKNDERRDSE